MDENRKLLRQMIDAIRELQDAVLPLHLRAESALANRSGELNTYKQGKRNPDCWVADLDLTCIPMHKSNGCLITPRHVLFARHFPYSIGDVVFFQDRESNECVRTVTQILAPLGAESDVGLAVLDAPVPNGITPALRMPEDYKTLIRGGDRFRRDIPVIFSSRKRDIYRGRWFSAAEDRIFTGAALETEHRWATSTVAAGDSGSPCFLVLPRQEVPVVLCCWSLKGNGPCVASHWREIAKQTFLTAGHMQLEADI